MRTSTKWSCVRIDGDVFVEGFLGLSWAPSASATKARNTWETAVDDIITELTKTHVGWNVLKALHDSKRRVTIYPNRKLDCNARANTVSDSDDAKRAASRRGAAVLDCFRTAKGENRGTGQGVDAKIEFSPSSWRKGGCHSKGVGRDADEILLHELVHAMRIARGVMNQCFQASVRGFGNQEEFIAIVISNLYSSETSRALRRDHEGFSPLPAKTRLYNGKGEPVNVDLRDPRKFCNWFRTQLTEFKRYQGPLANRLRKLRHVKWNPFVFL